MGLSDRLNMMFKRFSIALLILLSILSFVSSGGGVDLHLDGSGINGHLHAEGTMLLPMAKQATHIDSDGPEKILDIFTDTPIFFSEEIFLSSFDRTTNFSERAPPA